MPFNVAKLYQDDKNNVCVFDYLELTGVKYISSETYSVFQCHAKLFPKSNAQKSSARVEQMIRSLSTLFDLSPTPLSYTEIKKKWCACLYREARTLIY